MSGKSRGVYRMVLNNFLKSFSKKQPEGNFVGDDYFGNKYYEVPADPSRGKRHPQRWQVPPGEIVLDNTKLPAEWDAWLRHRRDNPPTEKELKDNLTVAMMKKHNADQTAIKEGKQIEGVEVSGKHSDMPYPLYEEYELVPGNRKKP